MINMGVSEVIVCTVECMVGLALVCVRVLLVGGEQWQGRFTVCAINDTTCEIAHAIAMLGAQAAECVCLTN